MRLRNNAPIVLAAFSIITDSNDVVPIIANVGWEAVDNAPEQSRDYIQKQEEADIIEDKAGK